MAFAQVTGHQPHAVEVAKEHLQNAAQALHRALVESLTALGDERTDNGWRQIGQQWSIDPLQVILEPLQIMPVLNQGGLTKTPITAQKIEEARGQLRRMDPAIRGVSFP